MLFYLNVKYIHLSIYGKEMYIKKIVEKTWKSISRHLYIFHKSYGYT